MKYLLSVLLAASIAAAAPALADNDHGRGGGWQRGGGGGGRGDGGDRGGWRGGGQGRGEGGGEPRGNGNGNGNGRGGRWNGPPEGYPGGPVGGPVYAEPPRGRAAAGGEYYPREQDEARQGVRSGAIRPMGEIVRRLERSHAGRMLDAQLQPGPNGRPVFRVIWAGADGRRSDYLVDAQTGAILQGY